MATCPSGHESASTDFCDVCGMLIGAAPIADVGQVGAGPVSAGPAPASADPGAPGEPCPRCGTARTGQFCESCGYDFTTAPDVPPRTAALPATTPPTAPLPATAAATMPPPVPPAAPAPPPAAAPKPEPQPQVQAQPQPQPAAPPGTDWSAVVTADRDYYDSVQAAAGPDAAAIGFPAYCPERRFRLSGTEVRVGRRSASRGIDPEIDLTGPPTDPGVSRLHMVLIGTPDGTWSVVDPGSENGTLVNGSEIPEGETVPLHDGDRIHLGAWTALTITRGG